MTTNSGSSLMTVNELASYLRVHPATICRLVKRGELPAFRVGSDWRFNREIIDVWVKKQNTSRSNELEKYLRDSG